MSKEICTLEYLANKINSEIKDGKLKEEKHPINEKCYSCTSETRCQFYMPLKRVKNIREGEILYRRNYRK